MTTNRRAAALTATLMMSTACVTHVSYVQADEETTTKEACGASFPGWDPDASTTSDDTTGSTGGANVDGSTSATDLSTSTVGSTTVADETTSTSSGTTDGSTSDASTSGSTGEGSTTGVMEWDPEDETTSNTSTGSTSTGDEESTGEPMPPPPPPTDLAHNEPCEADAWCASGYCRASAFDAQPRCLTPCSRAVALDCATKGLPGLCVETGDDAALLCAGDHTFGPDTNDNMRVAANKEYTAPRKVDKGDADLYLIDLSQGEPPGYYVRVHTNAADYDVQATWLDARGNVLKDALVKKNSNAAGGVLPYTPNYYFLIITGTTGLQGYHVSTLAN